MLPVNAAPEACCSWMALISVAEVSDRSSVGWGDRWGWRAMSSCIVGMPVFSVHLSESNGKILIVYPLKVGIYDRPT
jgi:hypothetical protein